MRILFCTAYDPFNELHGQGVIIKNTLEAISNGCMGTDVRIHLSVFRGGVLSAKIVNEVLTETPHIQFAPKIGKGSMIRSLLSLPLSRLERSYIRQITVIASEYDAVLWFGSPYDPITHCIAREIGVPVIYHVSDSISLHEERRQSVGSAIRIAVANLVEFKVLKSSAFASIIYVGAADLARAQALLSGRKSDIGLFHLPNGVDSQRFCPRPRTASKTKTILFAGSMCFAPNIDAAKRLVCEILPLLTCGPLVRIVGHSPTKEVRELAQYAEEGRIVVTGHVKDISVEYANADILVAPIERGAGIQNKVLEALASGIPVVTSSLVAGGMGSQIPGLYVCRTPVEYARIILMLLQSEEMRKKSGAAGRAYIEQNLTWKKRTEKLKDLLLAGRNARR